MHIKKVHDDNCPVCQTALNYASQLNGGDANPVPGDATFCSNCLSLLVFDTNLNLQIPTAEEMTEFENHPEIIEALAKVKAMQDKIYGRGQIQ